MSQRSEPASELERERVRRFRAGDDEAFREIVTAHREAIYAVARRMLRSHEEADEAAQQAFVRAWKARERFRGDAAIRTWLTRIVLNVAKSMLAARRPVEALEDVAEPRDPAPAAGAGLELDQLRGRVRAAVERLPERQRAVVLLKVFSELTHREVADVLEISEGAVKAHLHQAIANLRKRVSPVGSTR